jgi:hypothetical protein
MLFSPLRLSYRVVVANRQVAWPCSEDIERLAPTVQQAFVIDPN